MALRTSYEGPERRIHQVFVTRNTEYHVRRGVCVGVRPRAGGSPWIKDHGALSMRLEGHVKVGSLLPLPGSPKLGYRVYFADRESDVLTSPVIAIVRPPRNVVSEYPPDE